jgi:transcriptional regulator with XRE-family HTH domain
MDLGPTAVVARRVKELRTKRGWSAERLAQEMRGAGIDWSRGIVAKIESERRQGVSVAELFALSYVLNVSPVHMLVPPDDGEKPYRVTPEVTAPAAQVREWVRGYGLLPGGDRRLYLTEVPRDEFEEIEGVLFPKRQPWQLRQMQRDQHGEEQE